MHDKGQGTGLKGEVDQMLSIEAVRCIQERLGKGQVMTGEQVRWELSVP